MHWSNRRVYAFVLLFVAVAVVVVSSRYFILSWREDSAGRFLFIESRTIIEAQVLEGKWGRLIDFPHYQYDVSMGRIEYSEQPYDLERLIAVYGSFLTYRPAEGISSSYPIGGISSCLYPIYSTPCTACNDTSIIESIDKDGTVHIVYESKEIVLSPNQRWQIQNETIEHFKDALVKFKQTVTIENLGFWKKTNLVCRISRSLSVPPASKDATIQRPTRSHQLQILNAAKASAMSHQSNRNSGCRTLSSVRGPAAGHLFLNILRSNTCPTMSNTVLNSTMTTSGANSIKQKNETNCIRIMRG